MSKRPPFKATEASRPDFEKGYDIHYTKTPQPDWKPGGGLNDLPQAADFDPTKSQWRVIDPAQHEKAQIYKFMTSAILSPMSYFNMVSHNPPTIMISVSSNPKTESGLKDTSKNIRDLKEFCCSIISEPFLEAANYTAIDAPPDVDEWALSGLTKRASDTVKPPHVGEAGISMECELEHWHDLKKDDGTVSNTIILGRVKRFQTKEFLFDSSDPMKVLPEKLRSVHRLGGISYGRTVQMIDLPRPSWDTAKDDPDVQSILGGSEKEPSSTL